MYLYIIIFFIVKIVIYFYDMIQYDVYNITMQLKLNMIAALSKNLKSRVNISYLFYYFGRFKNKENSIIINCIAGIMILNDINYYY